MKADSGFGAISYSVEVGDFLWSELCPETRRIKCGRRSLICSERAAVHEIAIYQIRLNTIDRPVLRKPFAELLCKEIENFRHRIGGFHEPLLTEFRARLPITG